MTSARAWRVAAPLLVGYACALACPMRADAGREARGRPPARAFGIVWPILYLLLGESWRRSNHDAPYAALTALLGAWLVVFSCLGRTRFAAYVLAAIVATTVAVMCTTSDRVAALMLTPLLAWTHVALLLNWDLL